MKKDKPAKIVAEEPNGMIEIPGQNNIDDRPQVKQLLKNIKESLPELDKLLEQYSADTSPDMSPRSPWAYEDPIYRFYHYSFKVFGLQNATVKIVEALKSLLPGQELNKMFEVIIKEGTGKEFNAGMNSDWEKHTRPIIEAFFHARYFLEMCIKYGKKLDHPPCMLPSGWAAVLYLYNLR